jgi:hypothetical protein
MKKIGKSYPLESPEGFSVGYGTVDYTNNKSIYIDISSWVEPLTANNPQALVDKLRKHIRKLVHRILPNTPFNNLMYIVDLDLRESGVRIGKKSFMSCNITLYTLEDLNTLNGDVQSLADTVVDSIKSVFTDGLSFNKKKK